MNLRRLILEATKTPVDIFVEIARKIGTKPQYRGQQGLLFRQIHYIVQRVNSGEFDNTVEGVLQAAEYDILHIMPSLRTGSTYEPILREIMSAYKEYMYSPDGFSDLL